MCLKNKYNLDVGHFGFFVAQNQPTRSACHLHVLFTCLEKGWFSKVGQRSMDTNTNNSSCSSTLYYQHCELH